ncbi:MAG: hypothetical protein HZA53_15715 [Planctomycetes bacterium]|nr:hypothetical protein [Planctomycetota bacterium]
MQSTCLALVLALPFLGDGPDRVTLEKTGKVLEGRVVFDGPSKLVLRQGSKDTVLQPSEVREVRTLERSLAQVLDRDLAGADAAVFAELAQSCADSGLAPEARNFWLRVLLADPKHEAAGKALDVQRVRDEVRVPFDKVKRTPAELAKRQASWKEALEIPCSHFTLRTDLELSLALDVGLALERNYRRFYATLAEPLELYLFDEAPEVFVYGRAEDFPVAPVKGDPIWFAPGVNRLNVLAESDPSIPAVVHELTRLMLFNALRRGAGATAQVPQWTSTGIAELFAKAAPAQRFGAWSPIGAIDKADFQRVLADKLTIERVFNAAGNDFNADPKRPQMTAAAYSLVHFLVFGREGALRANYGRFLREGAKGKLSMGALTDALSMSKDDIERAWREHLEAGVR